MLIHSCFLKLLIYSETNGKVHLCLRFLLYATNRNSVSNQFHYLNINFCCTNHNLMSPKKFSVPQTLRLHFLISMSIGFLSISNTSSSCLPKSIHLYLSLSESKSLVLPTMFQHLMNGLTTHALCTPKSETSIFISHFYAASSLWWIERK